MLPDDSDENPQLTENNDDLYEDDLGAFEGDYRYMFDGDDADPVQTPQEVTPPSRLKTNEEVAEILNELNNDLNPSQRSAAESIDGPVIIIAGAGTGKTKTLTHRVATMLVRGVHPATIMVVTFTNKAAEEIKDRIEDMVGENAQYISAGTFHSIVFRKMLKRNADSRYLRSIGLDMNECAILDQDESEKILKESLAELQPDDLEQIADNDLDIGVFTNIMSSARAQGHDVNDFMALIAAGGEKEHEQRITANLWQIYNRKCRDANGIDFDDILVFCDKMLRVEPYIADQLGEEFRYIMLDEYQDTNRVQMSIMDSIARKYQNICVVGDEKQSIYAFRAADIKVILSFKNRYPHAKQINMNQNYRSYPEIINYSNACADAMNQRLSDGQLFAEKKFEESEQERAAKKSNKVVIAEFASAEQEAESIAKAIKRDLKLGIPGKEIAILYRNRNIKGFVERQLVDLDIPYRMVGDASFFQKKEVKDMVALIRFIFHPWDSMAGFRFLGATAIGVSTSAAKKAAAEGLNIHEFLKQQAEKRLKPKKKDEVTEFTAAAKKVAPFIKLAEMLREAVKYGDDPLFIKQVVAEIWDIYLKPGIERISKKSEQDSDLDVRLDNINYVIERLEKSLNKGMTIDEIIEDLSMMVENNPDMDKNTESKVLMMTIHGSKGLEFNNVYMIGLNNATMLGDGATNDDIEEGRRLNYVGMTRAKMKLTMTFAREILLYGKYTPVIASPFIPEIEERVGISRYIMKESKPEKSNNRGYGN